jgi:hypothetical protein
MKVFPSCPGPWKQSGVFTAVARAVPPYKHLQVDIQQVLNKLRDLPDSKYDVEHRSRQKGSWCQRSFSS